MANDPNTIQYVIQEDGFWYVASKDRTPGVPEITVSAKGVANGLSTEYNDGWDFGPDSYDPNSTASIPYTQTSGIQEGINYGFNNNIYHIVLGSGKFELSLSLNEAMKNGAYAIQVPSVLSSDPIVTLIIEGQTPADFYTYQTMSSNSLAYNYISPTNNYNGTIIYAPAGLTNGVPYGGNIFGTTVPNGNPANLESNVNIIVKNITIRTADGGKSYQPTAWQFDNFAGFDADNIVADVEISNTGEVLQPLNGAGISANQGNRSSNGLQRIRAAYVVGYASGILTNSAHFLIDSIFIQFCSQGIQLSDSIGSFPLIIKYADIEQCTYAIEFGTYSVWMEVLTLMLQSQPGQSGTGSGWWNANPYFSSRSSSTQVVNSGVKGHIRYYITGYQVALTGIANQFPNLYLEQMTGPGSIALNAKVIPQISLTANPPASGTVYQNTNPYDIEIDLPVYATTAGTAGYVTIAKGSSSSSLTTIGNQYVSGDTSDTSEQIIRLRVPAGWYYEFTASGVTFGTASVFAD